METLEQRVAESTEAAECEACSERIAQCECDPSWDGPFRFCQLGDREQEKALDQQAQWNSEDWSPTEGIDWELEAIGYLGFEIGTESVKLHGGAYREQPAISYSIGDRGEYVAFPCNWSAEKLDIIKLHEHVGEDCALRPLAIQLSALMMRYPTSEAKITCNSSGNRDPRMEGEFYPEGSAAWTLDDAYGGHEEDATITELARDVARWLLSEFRSKYQNLYDRDRCIEDIEANERRFDSDGSVA